jgi:hypothetical protein
MLKWFIFKLFAKRQINKESGHVGFKTKKKR